MPATKQLRISLFGEPLVRFDDAPIRWSAPRRALSLLVYLLLQRRPAPRDTLAFRLWPDAAESDARANLRRHLVLVQNALPKSTRGPWLDADHRTVHWRDGVDVWCDVGAFEALSADVPTIRQAVDLYTGDLASGLDDEWLIPERDRLRDIQFRNLRALIERARLAGSATEALTYADRILAMDPWREDAVRSAIASRAEAGDRAGALQFYREFEARLQRELGVAPMPETIAAYDGIRTAGESRSNVRLADATLDFAPAGTNVRSNIPAALSTFVGRSAELARLSESVGDARLTTIWGSGGVGKTRLACHAAQTLLRAFADGTLLIELGGAVSDFDVFSIAATVLGAQCAQDETPQDAVVAALRLKSILLIVDNCEHVIAPAVELVSRVLAECPGVTIIATSREPLGIPGETVVPLPPLDVPAAADDLAPQADDLRTSSAAQLFLERARTNGVELDTAQDGAALRTICRRLDGIPLALEIAARRARAIPLTQIATMLDAELQVLSGKAGGARAKQPSLEAAIDWSFALLNERGRRVLRRLSVFRGPFDLADAIAACSGANGDDLDVLDDILGLVDKSMVALTRGPAGSRYRLLETIRTFVRARADVEELDAAHHALALHYLRCITPHSNVNQRPGSMKRQQWFATVGSHADNVRGILDWALRSKSSELGIALLERVTWYFITSGMLTEAAHWYEAALATPAGTHAFETHPSFIDGMASVAATRGYPLDAIPLYERSLALLRGVADYREVISALQRYGFAHNLAGNDAEADRVFCEAQGLAEAAGDDHLRGLILYRRGCVSNDTEADAQALTLLNEAHTIAERYRDENLLTRCTWERSRNPQFHMSPEERIAITSEVISTWRADGEYVLLGIALQDLGRILLLRGQDARAIPLISEGLRIGIDARRDNLVHAFDNCAYVAAAAGDWDGAACLLGAARACSIRPASSRNIAFHDAVFARVERALGRADTAAALFAGGTWSIRESVGHALRILQEASAPRPSVAAATISPSVGRASAAN